MVTLEQQRNECIAANGVDVARILKRRKSLGIDDVISPPIVTSSYHHSFIQMAQSLYQNAISPSLIHFELLNRYPHIYSSFTTLQTMDQSAITNLFQPLPFVRLYNQTNLTPQTNVQAKKRSFSVESLLK